jgi:hypothetical protein
MNMDIYFKVRDDVENSGYWCKLMSRSPDDHTFIIYDIDYQPVIQIASNTEDAAIEHAYFVFVARRDFLGFKD